MWSKKETSLVMISLRFSMSNRSQASWCGEIPRKTHALARGSNVVGLFSLGTRA